MPMRLFVLVWAGLFWLPLQLAAQSVAASLLGSDRAASALSSDSGLVAALEHTLAPNGVMLWPGAPVVVSREEAIQLIRGMPPVDTMRLSWQPLGVEVSGDSTLGITWGVAVLSSRLAASAPHLGQYTAAWGRDGDRWTLSALLFNNVMPVATKIPSGIPLTRAPAPANGLAGQFVAADLGFARLAGDSGAPIAFRTWASPNAIVSGPAGLLIRGPAAIASGVGGPAIWRWHPVAAGASRSGDLG